MGAHILELVLNILTAPRRRLRSSPRTALRLALWLWIAFALVVWNVVFDAHVVTAARMCVRQQVLHDRGQGPAVTIPDVMEPAIARGARIATTAAGLVLAAGLGGIALARKRARGSGLEA